MAHFRLRCKTCNRLTTAVATEKLVISCVQCSRKKKVSLKGKKLQTLAESYAKTKKGKRPDIPGDYTFKSSYEANTARWLELKKEQWTYEGKAFVFPREKLKRGPWMYLPDFYLGNPDSPSQIIEVKGYLDPASRAKLRRLKKYFPDSFKKLILLTSKNNKVAKTFCEKVKLQLILYEDICKELKEAGLQVE